MTTVVGYIATRLVLRILDEDETVKDLAIKTIEELWFPPLPLVSVLKARTRTTAPAINSHDKSALLSKVAVIMGTSANFKDRQSPLEDVLHKIMADKDGNKTSLESLDACYAEICEALIDGLVDASDLPGFVSMVPPLEWTKHLCFFLRLLSIVLGQSISSPLLTLQFFLEPMHRHFYPISRTQARYKLVLKKKINLLITVLLGQRTGNFRLPSQDIQSNDPPHAKDRSKIWTGTASNFAANDNQAFCGRCSGLF